MTFYEAFFWVFVGFLFGNSFSLIAVLYLLARGMEIGKVKLKDKNGIWYPQ